MAYPQYHQIMIEKNKNIINMSGVKRVYVEKKCDYAVKAKELMEEMINYLNIKADKVRVLNRYDIENISDDTYRKALVTVFSEPPVDDVYEENFPKNANDFVFSVEFLPGQFDQRADSAAQCLPDSLPFPWPSRPPFLSLMQDLITFLLVCKIELPKQFGIFKRKGVMPYGEDHFCHNANPDLCVR